MFRVFAEILGRLFRACLEFRMSAEDCRRFFAAPLPELGRDVAMMVLCLGGINTVDLYKLRKWTTMGGLSITGGPRR